VEGIECGDRCNVGSSQHLVSDLFPGVETSSDCKSACYEKKKSKARTIQASNSHRLKKVDKSPNIDQLGITHLFQEKDGKQPI